MQHEMAKFVGFQTMVILVHYGMTFAIVIFYLHSAQHTVTYSNSRNGECFSIMHTCLALMIVGATLNDGDFGVITFDP